MTSSITQLKIALSKACLFLVSAAYFVLYAMPLMLIAVVITIIKEPLDYLLQKIEGTLRQSASKQIKWLIQGKRK